MKNIKRFVLAGLMMASATTVWAAGDATVIRVDGSSTVFPITEAVAEEFQAVDRKIRVTVGISGTGGGFKKFCAGEIDIVDASRPIKETEAAQCAARKIAYIELPVAYDGLAVLVHPKNDWVNHLTVQELQKIWEPAAQTKITHWNQIRPHWPNRELHLFGPGVDSGTFDYFTEVIVGKSGASRGDFTASEDDNVLVQGIATDPLALGFFGLAYYTANADRLKVVPVDDGKSENGKGPIPATYDNVVKGIYQPLSRPIFIYVSQKAATRPDVARFVDFYLKHAPELVRETGYVALPDAVYTQVRQRFTKRTVGSAFAGVKAGTQMETIFSGVPPRKP
jgi:phosphate transport system substrate-binding protein